MNCDFSDLQQETAKDEIITYFKLRFFSHVPKSYQFVNKFYNDFQSLHFLKPNYRKTLYNK